MVFMTVPRLQILCLLSKFCMKLRAKSNKLQSCKKLAKMATRSSGPFCISGWTVSSQWTGPLFPKVCAQICFRTAQTSCSVAQCRGSARPPAVLVTMVSFRIVFLLSTSRVQAQNQLTIPFEELFQERLAETDLACRNLTSLPEEEFTECFNSSPFVRDYACRYQVWPPVKCPKGMSLRRCLRRQQPGQKYGKSFCHCCGAYFHFLEEGAICSKFCTEKTTKYGQKRLITLPFGWGQGPDLVTLGSEDGTEVEIPCDPELVQVCNSLDEQDLFVKDSE